MGKGRKGLFSSCHRLCALRLQRTLIGMNGKKWKFWQETSDSTVVTRVCLTYTARPRWPPFTEGISSFSLFMRTSPNMLTPYTTTCLRALKLHWMYYELCVLVCDTEHRLHGPASHTGHGELTSSTGGNSAFKGSSHSLIARVVYLYIIFIASSPTLLLNETHFWDRIIVVAVCVIHYDYSTLLPWLCFLYRHPSRLQYLHIHVTVHQEFWNNS